MNMTLEVRSARLSKALASYPQVISKHLSPAIGRSTQEMARSAKGYAPKYLSTLVGSILPSQPSPLEGRVTTGVDYARPVEEGTKGGGFPPVDNILDWVLHTNIEPDDPTMSKEDLAFAIARSIAEKGTPAQPFFKPAFDDHKGKAEKRINKAIDGALKEISR